MKSGRGGASLVELCLAITLAGVVFGALLQAVSGFRALAGRHRERVALSAAWRLSGSVLAAELRAVEPGTDLHAAGGDTVALRVFRGAGIVCGRAAGTVHVRYRGQRRPEPAKDSVVVVVDHGETVHALLSAATAAGACGAAAGDEVLAVRLAEPPAPGALLLVFEAGSYHASGRALRYRRGRSGRQPLTAELFQPTGSVALVAGDAGPEALVVDLAPAVAASVPRPGARQRVAFLNARRREPESP